MQHVSMPLIQKANTRLVWGKPPDETRSATMNFQYRFFKKPKYLDRILQALLPFFWDI